MNGRDVSVCSKKRACALSQTGCAITTTSTWPPAWKGLERMRTFYTEKGIDILKDAVSIPGVSLH